jgi:hypothetical protein
VQRHPGTANPHFAEPVLGLAEGETRGLNAGYTSVAKTLGIKPAQ